MEPYKEELLKGDSPGEGSANHKPAQGNPPLPVELELVLVRHGHTQWNAERRYLGHTDLPLLPEERQQLIVLRRTLAALGGEFWRVYCSDLRRCRETLAAMAPQLEEQAVYDSRLREMDFGAWEGSTYEQLKDNRHYRSWIDHPEAVTPPEGEAWDSFTARVEAFWAQLEQEAELIAASGEPGGVEDCIHALKTDLVEVCTHASKAQLIEVCTHASMTTDLVEDCTHELKTERMEDCTHVSKTGPSASSLLHRPQPAPPSPPRRVLIVTHGGVIRLLLARLNEGVTFYTAAAPAPGEVTVLILRRDEGAWQVISHET